MLPVFATPLAFLGLLTLPALAAIYLLHNRSRPVPVSSLLLWTEARVVPEGGRRVERFRPPLLFWLELLLLLLLVLAAAGPHLPAATGARPLVVVLDDSFSMQAGDPDSPRKRAADALREELGRAPRGSVRLILAGEHPQLLGDGILRSSEVEPLLSKWTCRSAAARLDAAIALGLELGGDLATVLVLTDRAPDPPPDSGRIRWWAFGEAGPNVAIVNASRTPGPHGDRLLLEIANLAAEARTTPLRVESQNPVRELHSADVRLDPHETHRAVLVIPADDARPSPVRVSIGDDDLSIDNTVTLAPGEKRAASYEVRIGDARLRTAVARAAQAAGGIVPSDAAPALLFFDGEAGVPAGDETWVVRILAENEAEAFTGPFVLDRAHPLTDGLSLGAVVWGGGKSPLPGSPVVMAGNAILLADSESPTGRHEVRLRLRHDLSTLTESPAWPTLVWNLLHWRAAHLPGLDRANVRVGEEVTWTLKETPESVEMTRPGGEFERVPVNGRRAIVRADRPGLYTLRAGAASASFAANPLARDESDLTARSSGQWGEEIDATTLRLEYRDATWILALLAAAVAVLHLWLAARAPRPGAGP